MSEVKPYTGNYIDENGTVHGDVKVYLSADFDRVTAERDALQQRLNAADQKDDDLSFQLNDREASRYDWLQAAQAAEKRVEVLKEQRESACLRAQELAVKLAERDALLEDWYAANAKGEVKVSDKAYRIVTRTGAALSVSAEPSAPKCGQCGASTVEVCNGNGCAFLENGNGAPVERNWSGLHKLAAWVRGSVPGIDVDDEECGACGGCPDGCKLDRESPSIERDERAEFENHPHFKGMDFTRSPFHSDYYESPYSNGCWDGWKARAALDKATEGASHE